MKFAHIADAHLGAFSKNPVLKELNLKAFDEAIKKSIKENVDFIIIAGDLFHNPIPDMSIVRSAVEILKNAVDKGIRIYAVYGSHDFSAGSTALLDVLASTGLFKKIVNYKIVDDKIRLLPTLDENTGVRLVGISGLSSSQEIEYFEHLDREYLRSIPNPKIFVFHTAISELKLAYISDKYALPKSMLPLGFDYYAGGHLHGRIESELNNKPLVYPGALFGATYNDLDVLKERGFIIVEDFRLKFVKIEVCKFFKRIINADGLEADELEKELLEISKEDYRGHVVILKIKGKLKGGNVGDIDFHKIRENIKNSALDLLLNTYGLSSREREKVNIVGDTKENIEEEAFKKVSKYGLEVTKRVFGILRHKNPEGMSENIFLEKITREVYSLVDELKDNIMEELKEDKYMGENKRKEVKKRGMTTLSDFGGSL